MRTPRRTAHLSHLSARSRVGLGAGRVAAATSRLSRRGSGEVIGGRIALAIAPGALAELTAHRAVACVSGTNGKTTTTRLLASALAAAYGAVATNTDGANMAAGLLTALARAPADAPAALELDELWLPRLAGQLTPRVVVLLNISRDQLDRSNETRRIAAAWRALGEALPVTVAVANTDDPLVAWAAATYARTVWVAAGQVWTADAMVCPACGRLLHRAPPDPAWWCACGLRRPRPDFEVIRGPDGRAGLRRGGEQVDLPPLALPGRCNLANAAMALAAAEVLEVPGDVARAAMATVHDVAGRYREVGIADRRVRLLLAKNPAGWAETLDLLSTEPARPCVLGFNARLADGRDPSWLWDVSLERLAGRAVGIYGDRADDLGVRLAYAQVTFESYPDAETAVRATVPAGQTADVVANYTAFRELLDQAGP